MQFITCEAGSIDLSCRSQRTYPKRGQSEIFMAGFDHALLPGRGAGQLHDRWYARPVLGTARASPIFVGATAVALMAGLFAIDIYANPPISVGVLYGFAIFTAAAARRRLWVVGATAASAVLTVLGYDLGDRSSPGTDALFRCCYGIVLQVIIMIVVFRGMMVSRMLVDQAKLLDQTHDSVVLRRVDATLLYWNRGAVELFGWSFEEARQKTQAQLIGTGSTLPPMPLEAFIEHGPWHGEIEVFAKDGRRMIIDCRCSLLLDENDRPFAILTTGNDVTARHEASEHLRRSEMRYRNIFQTTGIGIWECDFSPVKARMDALAARGVTDLRAYLGEHPEAIRAAIDATICIDVNEASLKMFGARAKEEMLGPVGWVWPPESEGLFAESVIAAREGRESFEGEVVLNTLDGRRLDLFLSTSFPSETVSRESVFVTVADITARTAANAALRDAQADLAHATRLTSLGQLAASIAHEVNQPLAGMLANGQAGLRWLKREPPDLNAVETSLTRLVQEARRARAVVSGVSALAKNELPHPERLDLSCLIVETLRLVNYELGRSGVTVTTDCESDVRAVWADRVQVQQVLINLILNAAQAMAENPEHARLLAVGLVSNGDFAVVSIADNGPGIAPSFRESLFTAFKTTKADGMGIGLSLCASITRRHGGQIWLERNEGQGATFVFTVPFEPSSVGS